MELFTVGITPLVGICPCQTGALSAGYIVTPVNGRKWLFVYFTKPIHAKHSFGNDTTVFRNPTADSALKSF